tara:strand:+ start:242 stop:475 length:234 start_codon:yes stop_codon:yes gene_type:complete
MAKFLTKKKQAIELVANESTDENEEDIIFTISDTEYVLRKLVEAKIDGREVEQASDVMKKVKQLHKKLMEQGVAINS